MTATWNDFRRARHRARQAWAVLAAGLVVLLAALGWFFTAGQFALEEPQAAGPTEAPVLARGLDERCCPGAARAGRKRRRAAGDAAGQGPGSGTNYERSAFGQAWLDVDRNGCDTRNDILRRDLAGASFTEGSRCRIGAGSFQEPYTGRAIEFGGVRSPARRCRSTTSWRWGRLAEGGPAADGRAAPAPGE